jgi:hypothetical protein
MQFENDEHVRGRSKKGMEKVCNLYQNILHRKPDSESIIRYLPVITSNKITIDEIR